MMYMHDCTVIYMCMYIIHVAIYKNYNTECIRICHFLIFMHPACSGMVLCHTSPNDPVNVVSMLCHKHSSESVLLGEYSVDGTKVRQCSSVEVSPVDTCSIVLLNCTHYT